MKYTEDEWNQAEKWAYYLQISHNKPTLIALKEHLEAEIQLQDEGWAP